MKIKKQLRKEIFISAFIFVYGTVIYSQNLQQNFIFKVEMPQKIEFDTLLYEGTMHEFSCTRVFLKDSVFSENNMLGQIDTFKIEL